MITIHVSIKGKLTKSSFAIFPVSIKEVVHTPHGFIGPRIVLLLLEIEKYRQTRERHPRTNYIGQ